MGTWMADQILSFGMKDPNQIDKSDSHQSREREREIGESIPPRGFMTIIPMGIIPAVQIHSHVHMGFSMFWLSRVRKKDKQLF
jgi:hypothetical protein